MSDLTPQRLVTLADEIAAQAKNGTHWSKDRYDRERFERILTLSAEILGGALDYEPVAARRWYTDEPATLTSKIGVSAAAFDATGRLLLVQRNDNGYWVLPGGIAEYGETLAGAAAREALEESGVHVRVRTVLGIYEATRHGYQTIHHWQHVSFLADVITGTPGPSDETLAAGFFTREEVAALTLAPSAHDPIRDAFVAFRQTTITTFFDR